MKLKQLKCIIAIIENGFNVTTASEKLFISQPAVSKQIKMIEEELGVPIFRRNSKSLVGLTEIGEAIIPDIEKILACIENIQSLGKRHPTQINPELTIATTHTLANYRLVHKLPQFQKDFPQTPLNIVEATNPQILQMLHEREADFGWFTTNHLHSYLPNLRGLHYLNSETWKMVLIVPKNHQLAKETLKDLKTLAKYPLISYITAQKEPNNLVNLMNNEGLSPKLLLSARNADMIKSYVRQGLGLGLIADMAFHPETDKDLMALDLSRWLAPFVTYLAWNSEMRLRNPHYGLIGQIVTGINRDNLSAQLKRISQEQEDWVI